MFIVCKFRPFLVEQQLHSDKPSLSPQHRPGAWQMISNCGGVQEQKQAWGWGPPSVLLVPLSKDMWSREAAQKKMGVLAAASGLRLQGDRHPKLSAVCSALPGPRSFWNRWSSDPKGPPCQEQPHRCPHTQRRVKTAQHSVLQGRSCNLRQCPPTGL